MSKKAKLNRAISRREARIEKQQEIIAGLNRDRDNLKAAIAAGVAEIETLKKEAAQREETTGRAITNNQGLREAVGRLKVIVADLQATVAEQRGITKTLERQIDQAEPKVMIKPPVMASPDEASRFHSIPSRSFESDIIRAPDPRDSRHWTAL